MSERITIKETFESLKDLGKMAVDEVLFRIDQKLNEVNGEE